MGCVLLNQCESQYRVKEVKALQAKSTRKWVKKGIELAMVQNESDQDGKKKVC